MKVLAKVSGVLAVLCVGASGAAAVTVDVTHTGTIAYIEWENWPAPDVGDRSKDLIRERDTVTVSYSIDLDQPGVVGDPHSSTTHPPKNQKVMLYKTSSVSVTASSGLDIVTDPLDITLKTTEFDPGVRPNTHYFEGAFVSPLTAPPAGIVFGLYEFGNSAFSSDLTDLNNLHVGLSDGTVGGSYSLEVYIPPAVFGSSDTCSSSYCYMPVSNLVTTISPLATLPIDPLPIDPVTPVPVPAPFLMLGMAVLGLIGFGRRAKT